ncbi:MAG: 4Fe-4S binding protein [Desulfurococcales archaeon]|nr:4Fe-4S binding protein [Desulfurococcales archaeon]
MYWCQNSSRWIRLSKCVPVVDVGLCKGCGICVDVCPRQALVLSTNPGPSGYRYSEYVGGCIGCRMCEWLCPDFAIVVRCED